MKKRDFLDKISKENFQRNFFCQNRVSVVPWESWENQFGRPRKKGSTKFSRIFFENPPSPLEKIIGPVRPWFLVSGLMLSFKIGHWENVDYVFGRLFSKITLMHFSRRKKKQTMLRQVG